jgi:LacI family transcriptional regulator
MIFFDRTCPDIETDKVIVDDYKAAFEAVEYLIKSGCKRLCHFAGPENLTISKKRLLGFKDALKKHNLPVNDEYIIKCDTFKKGKKAVRKLIEAKNLPDAIFAVNDMTALGALIEIKKHNIKIPQEISIMGFTNGLISKISDPPLSTVEQNGYEMGYKTAQILLERIDGNIHDETKTVFIPTKLILRKTTL